MRSTLALLLVVIPSISAAAWPEQVHLAFHGDHSVMAVVWTTFQYDKAEVKFGEDPNNLIYTATDEGVKKWTSGASVRYSHRAMMRDLKASTEYCENRLCHRGRSIMPGHFKFSHENLVQFYLDYQIGVRRFSFKTLGEDPQNYRVCIFGDLGYFHGNSTASLIANGLAGKFDFIIHLGDIAYDLHTNNGATGDNYMNQLEPLISKVPYMVIAGNHEDDGKNFTDYQERFWMLHNGYRDNQFYSFDLGPVHWVGVSTEYYGYYYLYGQEPVMTQYGWLKNDLTVANQNRNKTPWIISFQHRPFYCSNSNSAECQAFENKLVSPSSLCKCTFILTIVQCDVKIHSIIQKRQIRTGWLDMPGLESLFLQQGMDMGFWGHEHSYERFYPIADKQFWNDGCHSAYAEFSDTPWPFSAARSAFRKELFPSNRRCSSFSRVNDYGYTILTIANSTHIHLEQISIEKSDSVVDEVWIAKDKLHTHSAALRKTKPGWKFPSMKCHPKNAACRLSLQQLNEEL
ncbi:Ser/Thr phosphatase family protein [Ancylostoma caninum]|uniref:Purple acid phosphatase n=1 Tax=Ancylostoma caninum TaxID=29170 RepID=A0A368FAR0_ANCCA|nr:Ser/Thr phosphatase family protein [Ancylostoma caninum]